MEDGSVMEKNRPANEAEWTKHHIQVGGPTTSQNSSPQSSHRIAVT